MPRFYFNTSDGELEVDEEGVELSNLWAARAMAARYAGDLLASEPMHLWNEGDWKVDVADENRVHLFTVHMRRVEGSGDILPGADSR